MTDETKSTALPGSDNKMINKGCKHPNFDKNSFDKYDLSNQNLAFISGADIIDIIISLATVGVTISVLVFIALTVNRHRKQPKHGNHSN